MGFGRSAHGGGGQAGFFCPLPSTFSVMDIERFDLERWQSVHEHDVEINLSESGVHPLRLQEIIETADLEALLGQELGYPQTIGTVQLRERVAALYDGASATNVLVTNGGSEANIVACWHLIEPGDEVVVIQPTYMQIPGLVRSFGATVREVWLEDDQGGDVGHGDDAHDPMRWRLDLAAVRAAVTPRTRCIAVCTPTTRPAPDSTSRRSPSSVRSPKTWDAAYWPTRFTVAPSLTVATPRRRGVVMTGSS